jgi:hypothetical protein
MAITYEQFQAMNREDSLRFRRTLRELSRRLSAFRDRRIAQGYPFDGRLAELYDRFAKDSAALDDPTPGRDAERREALERLGDFGALLNVNAGPGDLTVRDWMAKQSDPADQEKFREDLEAFSRTLDVRTDARVDPAFDYRAMNTRQKPVKPEKLRTFLKREFSSFEQNQRASAVDSVATILDRISEELDDLPEDQRHPEQVREVKDWARRIRNHMIKRPMGWDVPEDAEGFEKLRTGLDDFLCKRVQKGGETVRVETLIRNWNKYSSIELDRFRDVLDDRKVGDFDGYEQRYTNADTRLDAILDPIRQGKAFSLEDLCAVFGTRMAANAQRNDLKGLQHTVSPDQSEACKDDLAANKLVQRFYAENAAELGRLAARKRSHGGVLEDQFREFLTKLPPGELENAPILQRYMPSYQERIEALQARTAKGQDPETAAKAMAEIVVLRGMAQADRGGGRRLEAVIPCDSTGTLHNAARSLAKREDFRRAAEASRGYADKGHGGKLVEKLRENRAKDPEAQDGYTRQWLDKTTYRGMKKDVQVKAVLMLDELNHGVEPTDRMRREYRELALRSFGLGEGLYQEGKKPGEDVDWAAMTQKIDVMRKMPALDKLDQLTAEDMRKGLQVMGNPKVTEFGLASAFPELKAARQAGPEAGNEAEGPQHSLN